MAFVHTVIYHRQRDCKNAIIVGICSLKSRSAEISFEGRSKVSSGALIQSWFDPLGLCDVKRLRLSTPLSRAHVFFSIILLLWSASKAAAGIVIAVNLRKYLELRALWTAVGIVWEKLIWFCIFSSSIWGFDPGHYTAYCMYAYLSWKCSTSVETNTPPACCCQMFLDGNLWLHNGFLFVSTITPLPVHG